MEHPTHAICKKILPQDMNKNHLPFHKIVFQIKQHIETNSLVSCLYCKHILLVYLSYFESNSPITFLILIHFLQLYWKASPRDISKLDNGYTHTPTHILMWILFF